MLIKRKISILSAVMTLLIMCACDKKEAVRGDFQNQSTALEEAELNYGELALVERAHRHFGAEKVYSYESMSDAGGKLKLCGQMASRSNPNDIAYFAYSLDFVNVYKASEKDTWSEKCAFGWKPGTGR